MAQLIFAHAKSIRRKAKNAAAEFRDLGSDNPDESYTRMYNSIVERERAEFQKILEIAQLLHSDYMEITNTSTTNWYFLTVRPRPEISLPDFWTCVYKWTQRVCMISYKLSFEQKNLEGNGDGFHVHIVCQTKHRSKGECLRDAKSTFRSVAAENCINVKPTRNPENIINDYLIDYIAEDEHKEETKAADAAWRSSIGISHIYDDAETPLPKHLPKVEVLSTPVIKFGTGVDITEIKDKPTVLSWD